MDSAGSSSICEEPPGMPVLLFTRVTFRHMRNIRPYLSRKACGNRCEDLYQWRCRSCAGVNDFGGDSWHSHCSQGQGQHTGKQRPRDGQCGMCSFFHRTGPSKKFRCRIPSQASDLLTNPFHVPQINGIGSQNAQTSSVSVNPKYGTGSSNTIVGYTYSNQINVDVKNLTSALLSEVLDTAVASGGNQLQIQRVTVSILCSIHLNWHCFQVWQLGTGQSVPAQVPCPPPYKSCSDTHVPHVSWWRAMLCSCWARQTFRALYLTQTRLKIGPSLLHVGWGFWGDLSYLHDVSTGKALWWALINFTRVQALGILVV